MQHPFGGERTITKAVVLFDAVQGPVVLFDAVQGPDRTSKEYADVLPAG